MAIQATLAALLNEQAQSRPDATALVAPSRKPLSYSALHEQVQQLAGHLRAQGVLPEVGIDIGLSLFERLLVEPAALCALDVRDQSDVVVGCPEVGRRAILQSYALSVSFLGCAHYVLQFPQLE